MLIIANCGSTAQTPCWCLMGRPAPHRQPEPFPMSEQDRVEVADACLGVERLMKAMARTLDLQRTLLSEVGGRGFSNERKNDHEYSR